MKRLIIFLIAALFFACNSSKKIKVKAIEIPPQRFALVIGGSQYSQKPELSDLTGDSDAKRLEKALIIAGWNVIKLVSDANQVNKKSTYENIIEELKKLKGKFRPTDELVVILEMHGAMANGEDFYLPVDAYIDLDQKWNNIIPKSTLYGYLEASGAGNVYLFTDACRNNVVDDDPILPNTNKRGINSLSRTVISKSYEDKPNIGSNLFHIAAAKHGEYSLEYRGTGTGVFSFLLSEILTKQSEQLEADQDHNSLVSVGELFEYLRAGTITFTRSISANKSTQTPTIYSSGNMNTLFMPILYTPEPKVLLDSMLRLSLMKLPGMRLEALNTPSEVGCRLGYQTECRVAAPSIIIEGIEYEPHLFQFAREWRLVYYGSFGSHKPEIPNEFKQFFKRNRSAGLAKSDCPDPGNECKLDFAAGYIQYGKEEKITFEKACYPDSYVTLTFGFPL